MILLIVLFLLFIFGSMMEDHHKITKKKTCLNKCWEEVSILYMSIRRVACLPQIKSKSFIKTLFNYFTFHMPSTLLWWKLLMKIQVFVLHMTLMDMTSHWQPLINRTWGPYWGILAQDRCSTDQVNLGPCKMTEGQYSPVWLKPARLVSTCSLF